MMISSAAANSVLIGPLGSVSSGTLCETSKQLWLILGDGVNQAADLTSGVTSIPSWNLTPWMTFGTWF